MTEFHGRSLRQLARSTEAKIRGNSTTVNVKAFRRPYDGLSNEKSKNLSHHCFIDLAVTPQCQLYFVVYCVRFMTKIDDDNDDVDDDHVLYFRLAIQ